MKEATQEVTQEKLKEELSNTIKDKVLKYLLENEAIITAKTLILYINDTDTIAKKLAKFFVAIKRGYAKVNIIYFFGKYRNDLYNYSPNDVKIGSVDIDRYNEAIRIDVTLPNGVTIAEADVDVDDIEMLKKENYEATKQYEDELKNLLYFLKQLAINLQVSK